MDRGNKNTEKLTQEVTPINEVTEVNTSSPYENLTQEQWAIMDWESEQDLQDLLLIPEYENVTEEELKILIQKIFKDLKWD